MTEETKTDDTAPKPADTQPVAASPEAPQLSAKTSLIVVGLAAVFGVACFFAGRFSVPEPDSAPPPGASVARVPRPHPSGSASAGPRLPQLPPLNSFPEVSFAQQGEDLIIKNLLGQLGVSDATYLDIGAHDPMHGNNSFLFYGLGSHGVLVEPNPVYVAKLRAARPRDVVIDKGVGVGADKTAKYYDFGGDGQDNTFSSEQVERLGRLGVKPAHVIDLPLVDVNDVLAQNFPDKAPNLLSIDTEGLDFAILKKVDFAKYRPQVICVETLEIDTGRVMTEITAYLATKHYTPRGGTYVNTIYVADEALSKVKPRP